MIIVFPWQITPVIYSIPTIYLTLALFIKVMSNLAFSKPIGMSWHFSSAPPIHFCTVAPNFFFFFFFFFPLSLGFNSNIDFATFATGGHD